MIILRDLPSDAELRGLAKRYPECQPDQVLALLSFLRAACEVFHAADVHFARNGTSCGRFTVLALLNRDPEQSRTPSQIAGSCGVTRATITGLLDGLEDDGLVDRVRSTSDRRTMHVRLTAKGRRYLDNMLPDHFRRMIGLLAGLDTRDRTALRRIADRIAGNVSTLTEPALQRP